MKLRMLALVLSAAAFAGCKKKEEATSGSGGSGSGSAGAGSAQIKLSEQPLPPLPPLELPADPKREDKIALGKVLFFDKRLSGKNDRACYSCHMNEDGTGGHDPKAIGSGDKPQPRHAPILWNVGYWKGAWYWDGRAKTLEANVRGAWGLGNMGAAGDAPPDKVDAALDKRAGEIAAMPEYKKQFAAAFPDAKPVKGEHVEQAIAEYMRTLICKDTAYDKFAAGDKAALSDQQKNGLEIFLGKGQCTVCHAPPFFSTAQAVDGGQFFNVGIGIQGVPEDKVDIGRKKVSNKDEDWAAFKPPTLRNITKSPPYFHDGSVAKLEDAVRLMAKGGVDNKNKSALLKDRGLTDAEIGDLIAFLGALDCPGKIEEPAAKTPEKKEPAKKKGK